MNAMLLATLLMLPADPQQTGTKGDTARPGTATAASMLDGQWYLVYGEDHGKKIEVGRDHPVTIRNNVVTWAREGKQHSARLEFGANNTIRSYPMEGTGTGGTTGRETGRSGTGGTTTSPPPGTGGTATGRTGTSGTGANRAHQGVYIFSKEFLCLSLNDGSGSGASGTGASRTGTSGTGTSGTGTSRTGTGTSGTGTSGAAMGQPHAGDLVLILSKHPQANPTGR